MIGDGLAQDVRLALRQLRRSPGFALAATATLALGLGANTAVFSVADATLLRPLDLPEADRLVAVFQSDEREPYRDFVYSDWVDLRSASEALSGLAAHDTWEMALGGRGGARLTEVSLVSSGYFDVLGVRPEVGRAFAPSEDPGADGDPAVAVVSAGLAGELFGGAEAALGRALELNGSRFEVIGVAPRGFRGPSVGAAPRAWVPLAAYDRVATGFLATFDAVDYAAQRGGRRIGLWSLTGRLAPGASLDAARAELEAIAARLAAAHPESNEGRGVTVLPAELAALPPGSRGASTRFLALLGVVVSLVLLMACANVAGLFLARAERRRRELGVRMALGGGPARIARQLVVEGALLAAAGGAAGALVAAWVTRSLSAFRLPGDVPIAALDLGPDPRLLGFSVAAAALAAAAFSVGPALLAGRLDPARLLGGRAASGGRSRARQAVVGLQVGLGAVLLVGAAFFALSVRRALSTDLGFEPGSVASLTVDLGAAGYGGDSGLRFYGRLLDRVRRIPGVRAASLTSAPFGSRGLGVGTLYAADRGEAVDVGRVFLVRIGGDHFRTVGLPLPSGRGFGEADAAGSEPVAVVSRSVARRLWPGGDAVGRRFNFSGPDGTLFRVVGVAGDVAQTSVGEEGLLHVYLPLRQHPDASRDPVSLLLRTDGDPAAALGSARAAVHALDADVPAFDVATLDDRVAEALMPQRMGRLLTALFGALALALAVIGVYAVVAHSVARRRREIGIRLALGSGSGRVLGLVVREGARPVVAGLVGGLAVAALAMEGARTFLYGIEPADPLPYAIAGGALAAAALAATLVPALRAARVEPTEALRAE